MVAAVLRVVGVTAGLAESKTVGFMIHVTCRLTAKNRDQLRNPTLGSRVWATFTFLSVSVYARISITDFEYRDNVCACYIVSIYWALVSGHFCLVFHSILSIKTTYGGLSNKNFSSLWQ